VSRSILLVSHFYPPSAGAAVQRPVLMAKHLRRLGHRVTILTTRGFGKLPADRDQSVVRTFDLQLLQAQLRGRRAVEPILERATYSNRPHPVSYLVVPEALLVAWTPFAVAAAIRLHRRERFDCVITTSPPESAHLAGYALQRMGVPWIADIRDGWVFESIRPPWPTRLQASLDRRLERALMRRADAVTCVAQPLVDYFRSGIGANATLVPNGWDPEEIDGRGATTDGHRLLDPERVSLVHTGRLEVADRDPAPLVRALQGLAAEDPGTAARLELVFAGSFTERERALLATDVAPARIVVADNLPHEDALSLQSAADGLLLITAGTRRHEVTGKIFEYFGVGRPILALADNNEAARMVREAGAGITVAPGDAAAARDALLAFVRGEIASADEDARREYAYPAVAELMAGQVEAVSSRARS
jgi:glycosyltransferase involved in cell wall biosynthesis